MKSIITLLSLFLSSSAFAAGQAVYVTRCGEGARATLTSYAVWNFSQSTKGTFEFDDKTSFDEQIEAKANLLERLDPVMARALRDRARTFTNLEGFRGGYKRTFPKVYFASSIDAQIDPPEGLLPAPDSLGCPNGEVIPVVATSYLPQFSKPYVVNEPVWQRLSESQKAVTLVNMLLYELAGTEGSPAQLKAAKRMQYFAAVLFSKNWDSLTTYDYLKALEEFGILNANSMTEAPFGIAINGAALSFQHEQLLATGKRLTPHYKLDQKTRKVVLAQGRLVSNFQTKLPNGTIVNIRGGQELGTSDLMMIQSDGSFTEARTDKFEITLQDGTKILAGSSYAASEDEMKVSYEAERGLLCTPVDSSPNRFPKMMAPNIVYGAMCFTLAGELTKFVYYRNTVIGIKFGSVMLPFMGRFENPKFHFSPDGFEDQLELAFCGPFRGQKVNGKSYQGIHAATLHADGTVEISPSSYACPRNLEFHK